MLIGRKGLFQSAVLALSAMLLPESAALGLAAGDVIGQVTDTSDLDDGSDADVAGFSEMLDSRRRGRQRSLGSLRLGLENWPAGFVCDARLLTLNHLSAIALWELDGHGACEAAQKVVLDRLLRAVPAEEVVSVMTEMVLEPADCPVLTIAPELGIQRRYAAHKVRRVCERRIRAFFYSLPAPSETPPGQGTAA